MGRDWKFSLASNDMGVTSGTFAEPYERGQSNRAIAPLKSRRKMSSKTLCKTHNKSGHFSVNAAQKLYEIANKIAVFFRKGQHSDSDARIRTTARLRRENGWKREIQKWWGRLARSSLPVVTL
jgi:hypothetical protein